MKNTAPDTIEISGIRSKKRLYHRRSLIWIGAALVTILMSSFIPDIFFERWYYNGLFRLIRMVYDTLFGWLPFPMIYLIVILVFVRIIKWSSEWKFGIAYQVTRALGGIAWVIVLFYFLWGFNYKQIPLQTRLGLNLDEVTSEEVEKEFLRATEVLKKEAQDLPDHYTSDNAIASLDIDDHSLRPDVEKALQDLNVFNKGRVRVRQLWPKGFLLRWSTAGIYIPHAGEGHIDLGLLSVQKPFTIAHEMAHGYGITDEGACNFIAWLACSQSRDKWIRFGGALTYWRYAAAEMPAEKVDAVIHTFDPVVMRSLQLIRANDKKYPDILPTIRDAIYSSYLKGHGVKGGLESYDYVVLMVQEYLEYKSDVPVTPKSPNTS